MRKPQFTEAMRKQGVVIEDLEQLLNILLDRRSVENLDEQIRAAERLAADARALEERQRNLQTLTREAARAE